MSDASEYQISMAGGDGETASAVELICICTNQCPEGYEDNGCPPCRNMDPYEPCPVIGFGCGADCDDEEHCTLEQRAAADTVSDVHAEAEAYAQALLTRRRRKCIAEGAHHSQPPGAENPATCPRCGL